jgi:hypothetical protein
VFFGSVAERHFQLRQGNLEFAKNSGISKNPNNLKKGKGKIENFKEN